nr:divalent metal cation transporter [Natranaerobius trueperi]
MTKTLTPEEQAQKKVRAGALLGAAFLTATSAVGPGFLTQTAVFTEDLGADFAFVIASIILIHIGTQLNVWRIMSVSGMRAQDLATKVFPGLGVFVSILIALGGFAFNIGNLAGAGMGFNVLFGVDVRLGVVVSALIGCGIFLSKEMGKALDKFTKILGGAILIVIVYVAVTSGPPVGEAALRTVAPTQIPFFPIVTLIGGTVGGYIVFAGGNRLLDAGLIGKENVADVDKSALRSVGIASLVRIFLFLAVLGVVNAGMQLDPSNPPASAFQLGAGNIGYKMFG